MPNPVKRGRPTVEEVLQVGRSTVGDVLQIGRNTVEEVLHVGRSTVEEVIQVGRNTVESACIVPWRNWRADSTVLRPGDNAGRRPSRTTGHSD